MGLLGGHHQQQACNREYQSYVQIVYPQPQILESMLHKPPPTGTDLGHAMSATVSHPPPRDKRG
eukprot:8741047-Karenia_brevis.AAC.1